MGTDIHLCVETKTYDADTGKDLGWSLVPGPIIDCYSCDGTGIAHRWTSDVGPNGLHLRVPTGAACSSCTIDPATMPAPAPGEWDERGYYATRYVGPGKRRDSWYSDRNYVVFAVLGNVRNGYGFAGVYSHEPLRYLSNCRGLPDDMAADTIDWFDKRGGDHSDTWVNLRDVLTYDWDQTVHKSGVLDLGDWAKYRDKGLPETWSGDIGGSRVRYVDAAAMDAALTQPPDPHVTLVTRLQWGHPLGDFAAQFLERMRMLAMTVGEAPTRLVFNFDS